MGRAIGGDPADVASAFEHLPAVVWLLEGPEHVVVAANFLLDSESSLAAALQALSPAPGTR